MYPKMKRKVAKAGRLRLSPNEEAQLLKEEYERRRKLRLQQVREQERNIALQIRQDVKQRRHEQLYLLAEELKTEWQKAQDEKIQALEKLYLSSLREIGVGHREAKENEPDLEALAKQEKERQEKAEKRHKVALKQQKNQREKLLREQTWRANARKHALDVEKERAAKIASLPPPPPQPFEDIELKSVPVVKVCDVDTFSATHHHIFEPYVDREMDIEQPDARILAEAEAKRETGLQNEKERERREQLEKARLRGKHALKMVHLVQDREKLMRELEHMQNMDLARRRQIVAQMPPQLFEPEYRRMEIKEDWQRELECAFEDMYTGERKLKGDLILHLSPQPLPTPFDQSQDELEVTQDQESVSEVPPRSGDELKNSEPGSELEEVPQPQSKLALKKLLNKIRNQRDHWTSKSEVQSASEIGTIESGTIASTERPGSETDREAKHDPVSELRELPELLDRTVIAGNRILNHPQEEATKLRKEGEKQKQVEWLEQQKKQQLALLQRIEEQKRQLEADSLKAQMQCQKQETQKEQEKKEQECQTEQMNGGVPDVHQPQKVELKNVAATGPQATDSYTEDNHILKIRDYQQRLLMQNRMHRELVEEARKHLHEYQEKLKQRHQSVSVALFGPVNRHVSQNSVPEPRPQLQRFDVLQTIKLQKDQPSTSIFVGKRDEHSELPQVSEAPSKQKNEERFDVDSGGHIYAPDSQVHHRAVQSIETSCLHQKTEKLHAVETLATQSSGTAFQLHGNSLSSQPVVSLTDDSSQSSEVQLSDQSMSQASLTEHVALPASLKHQSEPAKGESRTTCEQMHFSPLHPPSSLPCFVASKAGRTQEFLALQNGSGSLPSFSDVVELRNRMLASSESIQAQQEHLKDLQEKLDEQREALLSRQKIQEDLLLQKHAQLKQQMEQQQEALRGFLKRTGQDNRWREMMQTQESNIDPLATISKEEKSSNWEKLCFDDRKHAENTVSFQSISSTQQNESSQDHWKREPKWKFAKPPLSKVKLGLDLDQHELSAIPELDTPRSGRLSATGYRESFTGDSFLAPSVGKLQSSKSPNESLHEETDILRITVDSKITSCRESQGQLNGSFSEKLVMETGNLDRSVFCREPAASTQDPSSSTDVRRIATDPDHSFRPKSPAPVSTAWSSGLLNSKTNAQQIAWGYLSASTHFPDNFLSECNSGRSLCNTESHSVNEEHKHFSYPVKEKANPPWDPSASLRHKQDEHLHAPLSFGEMLHSDGSKIQQMIDKYTQDFSSSSSSNLSSHDERDAADLERLFPNFHRELFQPMKPSSDLDTLSFSQSITSHHNKDMSKRSTLSENHELTSSSVQEISNSLSFLSTEKLSNTLPMEQFSEEVKKQTQGTEELFEHLPMESTLSELRLYTDMSGDFSTGSGQNLEIKSAANNVHIAHETVQCEDLEGNEENIDLYSSIENFRSLSLSPVEDQGLFFKLIPDSDTMKNSFGTAQSVKESVPFSTENLLFVELPTSSTNKKCATVTENMAMRIDLETDLSQVSSHIMGEQSSLSTGTILNLPQEMSCQASNTSVQNPKPQSGCVPHMFQKANLNTIQAEKSDFSLSVNIPVWETHSGRGIMEEPELTLISSNDISTAESDLEVLNQANSEKKKTESLLRSNHSEKNNFLPLNLEVDDSSPSQLTISPPSQNFQEHLNENFRPAALLSESTPVPGSLQESFFKRKKDFIERSSKRVEKIKNREQSLEKKTSQQKKAQFHKLPGAAVNQLKKMEDVKVCSVDDRKATEVQMYERTSRLYNNLAEVKIRREERERRENYARNRERAKEFQKKTLEKLRAKRATVKH